MSDDQKIPAWPKSANEVRSRFAWDGKSEPAPKLPPQFPTHAALHGSADYGEQICRDCWGAGWIQQPPTSLSASCELVKCERCASVIGRADNNRLAECWRLSDLDPHSPEPLTFGTFLGHNDAARAMRKAGAQFVNAPKGWLTIWGSWGGGKSHIGEAITRELLARRTPCLYMRAPELFAFLGAVDRLPGANVDYEGRLYWMQRTAVLVIDEFCKETKTDAVMRLRTSLLDYRYQQARANEGGATVILTNSPLADWPDQAIASRCTAR
jgi:DNA replication protein DnaC